jgi:four helix bundle protein
LQDFKKLEVWKKSHSFVLEVYQVTKCFPSDELYGLTGQTRRSAASIPTNIAEGCGRETTGELKRFLHIAMGSASELEYQLLLAHDLNYLESKTYTSMEQQLLEIKRMLRGFLKKLDT